MKSIQRKKTAIFVLGDLLSMCLAVVLATFLGYKSPVDAEIFMMYRWALATLVIFSFVAFIILDIYSLHKMPSEYPRTILIIGFGLIISAALSTIAFFFFREPVTRAMFILYYLFALLLIALFRYVYGRLTITQVFWKVLCVGDRAACGELAGLIEKRLYLRSRVVGYLSTDAQSPSSEACRWLGTSSSLLSLIRDLGVNQIIVACRSVDPELMNDLLSAMKARITVSDQKHVIEAITGKVSIDHLSDTWFIDELSRMDKRYFWYVKRCVDVILGFAGLCLSAPLIALSALITRMDSLGPAFYAQERIGRRGVPFRMRKLRTMVIDADKKGSPWTLDNDERITRVGRVLRKLHIDEAPQFWNIVKGDMSLIGPRPEARELVDRYKKEIPYYDERHMVTPGITGWAQINYPYGNSIEDAREKLKYDFYYIKNRTILFDLLIFLRTVHTVMTGKGAL